MNPLAPIALIAAGVLALLFSRSASASVAPSPSPSPDPDVTPGADPDELLELGRWQIPDIAAPYDDAIDSASMTHSVPARLIARVLWQESGFRPDVVNGTVRGAAGELGIAQFMPTTADDLGIDPLDPEQAIEGAARYLRQHFARFGTWHEALAAYNWGQGNVSRKGFANAPASTRRYVNAVLTDVFGRVDV